MIGVQLIGKKAVIGRYEKLDCEAWALYQGKQFIAGGNGALELQDWLNDFEQSGSTAIYTMRVYDSEECPTSSTSTSNYIACVHFKVVDTYEGLGINGYSNKLTDRIGQIEDTLKKLSKPDDREDDEGSGIGAIVMDWLQNPEKLAVIFGIAKQVFTGMPVTAPAPLQTISGFKMSSEKVSASSPEGLERIAKALDILGEHDPDLVAHLEQLAKLASTEPLLFKHLISKVNGL